MSLGSPKSRSRDEDVECQQFLWEVVPGSSGRGTRKGDKGGGVITRVTAVGGRSSVLLGALGASVEQAPGSYPTQWQSECRSGGRHQSLVDSCSQDVLLSSTAGLPQADRAGAKGKGGALRLKDSGWQWGGRCALKW